jgi:Sec-independent protein translocase protein TatA
MESRIIQLLFGQSKLEGLSSSYLRWRKGKQRTTARERERERERERK